MSDSLENECPGCCAPPVAPPPFYTKGPAEWIPTGDPFDATTFTGPPSPPLTLALLRERARESGTSTSYFVEEDALGKFMAHQQAEIDAAFKTWGETLSRHMLIDNAAIPWTPPARWSGRWWRAKWYVVRSALIGARRRVGLWVGGIRPEELDCDC